MRGFKCSCGEVICPTCNEQDAEVCDRCGKPYPSTWRPPKGDETPTKETKETKETISTYAPTTTEGYGD